MSAPDSNQPSAVAVGNLMILDEASVRVSMVEWTHHNSNMNTVQHLNVVTVLSDADTTSFPFLTTKDLRGIIKVSHHTSSTPTTIRPPAGSLELKGGGSAKMSSSASLNLSSSPSPAPIARPPATRMVSGLRFLLTRNAYSRIVAPLVAQEQHEYFEAILRGDERLAWWIGKRMYVLIVWNTFWAFLAPLFAKVFRGAG